MSRRGRLADRTVLVTGAARGIGRAIARLCATEGAVVGLNDLSGAPLGELASELRSGGAQAFEAPGDVTSRGDVRAMVDAVMAHAGRIDVLVNNAGGISHYPRRPDELPLAGPPGASDEVDERYWDYMFELNCKSAFLCCQAVIPIMRQQARGVIVNIASQAARRPMLRSGVAYNSAKSALLGLTRHLALELAPTGIRCNAVASGLTRSDRVERLHLSPGDVSNSLLGRIPLGRPATVEEQAYAVLFLASEEASYITGATLDVDGGFFVG